MIYPFCFVYNFYMTNRLNINKILIIEAIVWFSILCLVLTGIRIHNYKEHKATKQYQLFLSDVDGLIIGSPVKYMGVQVGYVNYVKIVGNEVYIKFILHNKDAKLPKGVVANVEFSGMGGTKSLELYPPTEKDLLTEKIINIKDTFRLSHTVDLLDNMMSKLALIGGKFSYFMKQVTPMAESIDREGIVEFSKNLEKTTKELKKLSEGAKK